MGSSGSWLADSLRRFSESEQGALMPTLNSSPTRKPRPKPAPALASWAQHALQLV